MNWKAEYPYKSNFIEIENKKYHYLDEGNKDAEVIVMLHGNPTWSFYYRNIVNELKDTYRCIVPDHFGCGLSDKPQDYDYTLENHINNVLTLLDKLGVKKFKLLVHDWGGAIGMGVATSRPQDVTGVILLNTAAFRSLDIPKRIALCKLPVIGEPMVRAFNAFAWPATFMTTTKPLAKHIKEGYLHPYNNYANRIATARFVKDIPLSSKHPTYSKLSQIEDNLKNVTCPKMFLWGAQDFCFNMDFLKRWKDFYPDSKYVVYQDAGHYVIEDEKENCLKEIKGFLNEYRA
ncbi:alpha/beta fold hydrolase [Halobacteriovorax sp. DA5]|uniref:alpha/beta fold hydrolase n=1 Tax=Halobacteriovorax sp. DA5 TaxID=2067553 RepID=UPI000CD26A45|nr:alpha/beta fold hydrolase [Halobacteriovorax sp. DA5]POB14314.1 alpha/beta hydrolase [Halobacteriovorax sp. DA5]